MFDGYIRVSRVAGREGGSFISPESQKETIEKYAAAKDLKIGKVKTSTQAAARWTGEFNRALERIKEGSSKKGIIFAKLSRFGRNTQLALAASR